MIKAKFVRYLALACLGAAIILCALAPVSKANMPPKATSLWFGPESPIPVWHRYAVDFIDLFKPNAPWQKALSKIQVFELNFQFCENPVFNGGSTDDDFRTVNNYLQQHHIALAIGGGLVSKFDPAICPPSAGPQCAVNVEGFGGDSIGKIMERLKRLGVDLRYVEMDEPLWYGHVSKEANAPQASIEAIARNVAKQVAVIHQTYPNAEIGDVEPLGDDAAYTEDVRQWVAAYKSATGMPLAFFHFDINWHDNFWPAQLAQLSELMRTNGVRSGIDYTADGDETTGVASTTHSEQHFVEVETNPNAVPDDAFLVTWSEQPNMTLPETTIGTMTYLVNRYAAAETILHVGRTINGFEGKLTTRDGKPVANAHLTANEMDDGIQNIQALATLQNKVPANASIALLGLRINTECNCAGPVNMRLGSAQYTDLKTQQANMHDIVPPNQKLIYTAQQTSLVNTPSFPVVAGDDFTFSVPMQASYASQKSGYVTIIFQDAAGKGITRMNMPFQAGHRLIWAGVTNKDGQFAINLNGQQPAIVKFDFSGADDYRLSTSTIDGNVVTTNKF